MSNLNFEKRYYHCDIKPANLLLVPIRANDAIFYEPRIIDFDLVFKQNAVDNNPHRQTFTYTYRPPEF